MAGVDLPRGSALTSGAASAGTAANAFTGGLQGGHRFLSMREGVLQAGGRETGLGNLLRKSFTALAACLFCACAAFAGASEHYRFLSAAESDPEVMGWMRGFPPAADKLITHPYTAYFTFPKLRWTVCHLRELLPTVQISRGVGTPVPLRYQPDDAIDRVAFMPIGGRQPMTWETSLAKNYTDGILILHEGVVVYERYFGCLSETGKHAAMSMTKSLIGLMAEILVVEGRLDDFATVSAIIPELAQSGFGSATVRQVMDMTTALAFDEDYANPRADIWLYSEAASPLPKPGSYRGPVGYFDYLQTVKASGSHGRAFSYRTINTDALGWIISRVTGKSVSQLLSDRIWTRIGAEQDAYMTVDTVGTPFAGGGLSAGLRDLGRIGLLMLNGGEINGQRLLPPKAVERISRGGSREAFAGAGYDTLEGGSYRSMWWVLHNAHGAFAARGVHGQTLYIDPEAKMVIVRFASFPVAKNAVIDPTSLPAYEAVAEYLMGREQMPRLSSRTAAGHGARQ